MAARRHACARRSNSRSSGASVPQRAPVRIQAEKVVALEMAGGKVDYLSSLKPAKLMNSANCHAGGSLISRSQASRSK